MRPGLRALLAALLVVLGAACAAPRDAFLRAERSLLAQDLPGALVAFDAVPVSHPRYPEARAAALGVERRMRRSHELLLEALLLRAEWRDRAALDALRRVRAIWPRMPGIGSLIAATEHRARLMHGSELASSAASPPVAVPDSRPDPARPADDEMAARVPATPAVEVLQVRTPAAASPPGDGSPPEPDPSPANEAPLAGPEGRGDPVALGLVAVETLLGRGSLEAAVAELIELSRRFPADVRVRLRLARVLHQRALQRYGQGRLDDSIVDWQRVVRLDPRNAVARSLLAAARAEAGSNTPRR